jgi:hypothetical protein
VLGATRDLDRVARFGTTWHLESEVSIMRSCVEFTD